MRTDRCVHICTPAQTDLYMGRLTHIYSLTCLLYMYDDTVIHVSTTCPYTDIHTCKSTCNVHTCIYIFVYTCIHLCMHTYTHICIYNVHKYTYGRGCTPVTGSAHSCPSLKQLSQVLILTLMGAFLPLRVYLPGLGGPVHKSVCCASMMTQVQILSTHIRSQGRFPVLKPQFWESRGRRIACCQPSSRFRQRQCLKRVR